MLILVSNTAESQLALSNLHAHLTEVVEAVTTESVGRKVAG